MTASGKDAACLARVLFVCLGNICRSPTAEAVFRHKVHAAGMAARIEIDSAGTGDWHIGEPPDRRAIAAAKLRGYDLAPLRGRQVRRDDFVRFDWILAMDRANLHELAAMRPAHFAGELRLLLDLAPELGHKDVPDPYAGRADAFDRVLDLIEPASDALLARILR